MAAPHLHFSTEEFDDRRNRVCAALQQRGLDGLLLFKIEDMYWLSGLDTDGFVIFHAMLLRADGRLTHVTRSADVPSIRHSSLCQDLYLWIDDPDDPPVNAVRRALAERGMQGKRIGVQYDTYGLTAHMGRQLDAALAGWCDLVDCSDLIRLLRLKKSPRELEYHRRAGAICDEVLAKAIELTVPGAFEGDILAEMHALVLARDGDPSASRWPAASGTNALCVRYTTGRKHIAENDQVTYEIGNGYRHYHAACMAVALTGPRLDERHRRMHSACVEALEAVQAQMRPGRTAGSLFDAHARVFESHGYGHALLNACGYTMGACFPPSWMEHPMLTRNNPLVLEAGMTFFTHMILVDNDAGLTMSVGEQAVIGENGIERVTHAPREFLFRG